MRAAFVIAARDLRQKLRDRSVLMITVAAPLGLAVLFSTLIPNQADFHATYAAVDLDGGRVARGLVDGALAGLEEAGVAEIKPIATEAEARAAVEAGEVAAAIVIPAGFTAAVEASRPAELRIVGGPGVLASEVARSVLVGFGDRVTGIQVAVRTVVATAEAPADPALIEELVEAALAAPAPIEMEAADTANRVASASTFYSASMAVLFVFFAAQFGVLSLLSDRRAGTLARMLAAPIAPATILVGKYLVSLAAGALSMTVVAVVTTLFLGADWGDPLAVAALVLAVSFAAAGIATLVVGFARTEGQADGLGSVVAMALALFGGTYFPMAQAPDLMRAISWFTPHAWFLRGINDLAGGGDITIVAPSLAVLAAIGLLAGGLGLLRARRVVAP